MTVNDPDFPHVTEVRQTYGTAPEPAVVTRTVVRESNTGWWLAAFVAVVAILAVVFLVMRAPSRNDDQVQAAIENARTQAVIDAQNAQAAQSAAAQTAAQQAADAQARAELAARQASLAAQQASQRQAERALERANRDAQTVTITPPASDASSETP